eukprot:gene12653-3362_t
MSLSMLFLLTPITFRVFDLVGYRLSLLLGGTLIGLSLVATSFASSIFETYFTLGLVFAIGQSLCYFAPLLILPLYFKKNLSLAHGIVMCGNSLGGLAQAPGLGFILQKYGFSSGMRLSSVTALVIIAVSVLFKRPGESFGSNPLKCRKERRKEITTKSRNEEIPLLRNYAYIMYTIASMLSCFGIFIPFVHLVRLAMDAGIPYHMAVFLPGIISFAQAVGKVTFGKLASLPKGNKLSLSKWAAIITAVLTTFVPILTSFIWLTAYSLLYGFVDGGMAACTMLIVRDLLTKEQFNRGYSIYLICNCFALLAGPPFAGYLYTVSGNYSLAFFISGGFAALAGFSMFAVQYFHSKNKRTSFSNLLTNGCNTQKGKKIVSFMQNYFKPYQLPNEQTTGMASSKPPTIHNSFISLLELDNSENYVDDSIPEESMEGTTTRDIEANSSAFAHK